MHREQREDLRVAEAELDRLGPREPRRGGIVPAADAPAGAEVHVIDGAGHSPHIEAAGEVNRLMERFLTSVAA